MATEINSDLGKVLNQTFKTFSQDLKPLMVTYFDTLDELLYGLADKAKSQSKKKLYFESMRSLRVHKLNVLVSYLKTIQQTFVKYANKDFDYFEDLYSYDNKSTTSSSFDHNEVEERLTQNNLVNKFESISQNQLAIITPWLSSIIGVQIKQHHNPICPFVLVSTFAKSIRLLHLDQNVKMILYKHYELNVMPKIKKIYQEIITYLISKKAVQIPQIGKNGEDKQTKPKNHTITSAEILNELDELQMQLSIDKDLLSPNWVKKSLMTRLEHIQLSESRHIDYHDLYRIDLISMLFQMVVEDNDVPELIQNIIVKLHIPYLKYAMEDEMLVENKQHPAQILINTMHSSSIGWSKLQDINQSYIKKISSTVSILIEANVLSETLFKVVLKDYKEFIKQQENEFALELKRRKKRDLGKTRIIAAMKTVDALIAHKTESVSMPQLINDIIMGPWKNLLSLLLVRYSDTSEEYLKMTAFIDDIILLLESEQYNIIIETHIDKLSEVYTEGLELVAYSGDVLNGRVKKFRDCLLKHHQLDEQNKNSKPISEQDILNQVQTKKYSKIPENYDRTVSEAEEVKSPSLQGFNKKDTQLLASVPIGTWVEFPRFNKDSVKAQLSWINPKSGKYIFVNSRGLKVTDKSPKELLAGLKDKMIIVEDSLI